MAVTAIVLLQAWEFDDRLRHFYPTASEIKRSKKTETLVANSRLQGRIGLALLWLGLVGIILLDGESGFWRFMACVVAGIGGLGFLLSRFQLFGPYYQRRRNARRRMERERTKREVKPQCPSGEAGAPPSD